MVGRRGGRGGERRECGEPKDAHLPELSDAPRPSNRSPGSGRRLKLANVLGPVARQHLQPLPPRHGLAVRAAKAWLVEVSRVARRLHEPHVRLPDLAEELIEALVRVEST